MTYYKKRRIVRRKTKDIILLALRNLRVSRTFEDGEHLICTSQSYDAMKDKIKRIIDSFTEYHYEIIPRGNIVKIRRTA